MHRHGSIFILCLIILALLAALAFGFLSMVTSFADTNTASTRLLLAQQAAVAGRVHAIESILRDYGERGTFVRKGATTATWTAVPGVRVGRLDGRWRAPFLASVEPASGSAQVGTLPRDDVSGDARIDQPYTQAWGLTNVPPFDYDWGNTNGRGRFFEIENYPADDLTAVSAPQGAKFSDLATLLPAGTGTRNRPVYYTSAWRNLEDVDTTVGTATARLTGRYRLRYAVITEELDSHLPINATGRDHPYGRDIRETHPNAVNVTKPYDPTDAATIYRRIVRYSPTIFNLSYCAEPFGNLNWESVSVLPIWFGNIVEHIFQGRGLAFNLDQDPADAGGYPRTWPLMYRRGAIGSSPDNSENPMPSPTMYNSMDFMWNGAGRNEQPFYLYTDPLSPKESKYGGAVTKNVNTQQGLVTTYWHALMGRQISFSHLFVGMGANLSWLTYHPVRAWSMFCFTPFSRGLELRNPADADPGIAARDPSLRFKADVDTPSRVNLLTCAPVAVHTMMMAYLPPQAKSLAATSISYSGKKKDGTGFAYGVNLVPGALSMTIPSRDPYVRQLWEKTSGTAPFDFLAPKRTVDDGVVDPDWYSADWMSRKPMDMYPGGAITTTRPEGDDAVYDTTGWLIRTDSDQIERGIDTLWGRRFYVPVGGYTVSAPAVPPGWGIDGALLNPSSTKPIDQFLPNGADDWNYSTTKPISVTRADGSTIDSTATTYYGTATVTFGQGTEYRLNRLAQLSGTNKSFWIDLLAAFQTSITVLRAQWTQYPGYAFNPFTPASGNDYNRFFRNRWDPAAYSTLADFDRVFLAQLGIDKANPSGTTVATGWWIDYRDVTDPTNPSLTRPTIAIDCDIGSNAQRTWNSGENIRTIAGDPADDKTVQGSPKWQLEVERSASAAGDDALRNPLYPSPDPQAAYPFPDNWLAHVGDAAFTGYRKRYGLAFAKSRNGSVFSSRLRTAAMEMLLNDWRYSFLGSSPEYARDFRPLDFNGDGRVNCSVYPANALAFTQEKTCHLDHWVDVEAGTAQGRSVDPAVDAPFCIAGSLFMGKSRFYRITTRGEVWDNVLGRMVTTMILDSAVCLDSGDRDNPKDLSSAHLLYQRFILDPNRPGVVVGR